jgi:outer membrane receptor protein involved in Fe transport
MTNFKLHGDFSYLKKDKFSFTGGVTINGYTGMKANDRAWNTLPVEANASLRWKAHKHYTIKSDFLFFAGGHYLDFGNISKAYKSATDWSVGIDAILYKRYGAFLNLNNIFGKSYERWHNYPVYGMNVLAGLQMRF